MKLGAIIAIAPLTAVGLINDAVISICQSWPHGYWVSGLIREEVGRLWLIRTQKQHERLLRLFNRLLWPNECNSYHWSFRSNRRNNQTKHSRITKTWPIVFEYRERLYFFWVNLFNMFRSVRSQSPVSSILSLNVLFLKYYSILSDTRTLSNIYYKY